MVNRIRTRLRDGYGNQFTADDLTNGTLVLNFVDKPPTSLSMDFLAPGYSQWASDSTSSLAGLVGYYMVKG